ncbi:LZTS1 protein, partial [Amia calva]|nr:LZTS1 protein [Amia calva]
TMGSVSSLISGHSLHSKHCRATEYKLKKAAQSKKASRSADGLLRYGFSQDFANTTKTISHAGKSEDFFYIKVSHKPRGGHKSLNKTAGPEDNQRGPTSNMEAGSITPPKLVPFSGKLEKGIEKGLIRPTAFKPVIPRSCNSTESHNNLNQIINKRLSPSEKTQEQKQDNNSGTLSDSGRNSMSSLPTHSTSGSCQMDNLGTSVGLQGRGGGGSAQDGNPSQNGAANGTAHGNAALGFKAVPFLDNGLPLQGPSPEQTGAIPFSETATCVRSPISTDEILIQQLEQRLLERESELQELQVSFEEKESDTCQLFEEKQKYCKEEMEGLKQRCSTKLRQVSQKALRAQQVLQLQVFQLQQERKKLQEDTSQLSQEKDLLEMKLSSYKKEQTQLAPTLEETQWEVCQKSGEISLLKQQLKESQGDVSHKLNEIVSLKSTLKEIRGKMEALEQKIKLLEETVCTRAVEVEGTITVYDLKHEQHQKRKVLSARDLPAQEFVSPDSKFLIGQSGTPDWTLCYWMWEKHKVLASVKTSITTNPIYQVSINPQDNTQICVSGRGVFKLFHYAEGALKQSNSQKLDTHNVLSHAWLSAKQVILGTETRRLLMMEGGDLRCEMSVAPKPSTRDSHRRNVDEPVSDALHRISAIATYVKGFACVNRPRTVCLSEKTEGKERYRKTMVIRDQCSNDPSNAEQQEIATLCFNPLEETLITSTDQGRLYSITLSSVTFIHGGHMFAAVNVIHIFSTTSFKQTQTLQGHNGKVRRACATASSVLSVWHRAACKLQF